MAEDSALEYETATGNDYEQHEATYHGFVQLIKWSVGSLGVTLFLMYWFLT